MGTRSSRRSHGVSSPTAPANRRRSGSGTLRRGRARHDRRGEGDRARGSGNPPQVGPVTPTLASRRTRRRKISRLLQRSDRDHGRWAWFCRSRAVGCLGSKVRTRWPDVLVVEAPLTSGWVGGEAGCLDAGQIDSLLAKGLPEGAWRLPGATRDRLS